MIEGKTEQSYEIKSIPFNRDEIHEVNNYLKSNSDEQYIVIDLRKLYLHKINDQIALTFAFYSSCPLDPLLDSHFLLGKISKNRLKILDVRLGWIDLHC